MRQAAAPMVLVVPQWQGSSVAAQKLLDEGAYGSARMLRPDLLVEIPVDVPTGDQADADADAQILTGLFTGSGLSASLR